MTDSTTISFQLLVLKVHCYKKCPAVDRKIRTTSKSAIQGSSEAGTIEQTKPSHDLPTDHSPTNHPPLDSIQAIFGYIEAEVCVYQE